MIVYSINGKFFRCRVCINVVLIILVSIIIGVMDVNVVISMVYNLVEFVIYFCKFDIVGFVIRIVVLLVVLSFVIIIRIVVISIVVIGVDRFNEFVIEFSVDNFFWFEINSFFLFLM